MATILIVDDDAALRDGMVEAIGDLGHSALEAPNGSIALAFLESERIDAVLLDLRMPGMDGMEVLRRLRRLPAPPPVAVLTAVATPANTIEAMRLGAIDHLAKPVGRAELAALLGRMIRVRQAESPAAAVTSALGERNELVGASHAMREVQKAVGMLADSDASVLLTGETGTGKEVVARAIHEHGRRSRKPFVAINCAAIPSELLESELFGHLRGAFTGAASDRLGSFRDADGGTIFLDEIGDMSLAMQAKLLRVLQDRQVTPVGGKPVPVDVRIVSATHRDLAAGVRDGSFRQDLFYRLGVVPLPLPPLRERLADIVPLAEHFLRATGGARPKALSADAAAVLLSHGWPGNVRELKNTMERVCALVRQPVVIAADLHFLGAAAAGSNIDWLEGELSVAVERLEMAMIRRALAATDGNRAEAARRLGIHRQLLHTKMRRYAIEASGARAAVVGKTDEAGTGSG